MNSPISIDFKWHPISKEKKTKNFKSFPHNVRNPHAKYDIDASWIGLLISLFDGEQKWRLIYTKNNRALELNMRYPHAIEYMRYFKDTTVSSVSYFSFQFLACIHVPSWFYWILSSIARNRWDPDIPELHYVGLTCKWHSNRSTIFVEPVSVSSVGAEFSAGLLVC